jgi:hypothetical protein
VVLGSDGGMERVRRRQDGEVESGDDAMERTRAGRLGLGEC